MTNIPGQRGQGRTTWEERGLELFIASSGFATSDEHLDESKERLVDELSRLAARLRAPGIVTATFDRGGRPVIVVQMDRSPERGLMGVTRPVHMVESTLPSGDIEREPF